MTDKPIDVLEGAQVSPQKTAGAENAKAELAKLRSRAAELDAMLAKEGMTSQTFAKEISKESAHSAVAEVWPRGESVPSSAVKESIHPASAPFVAPVRSVEPVRLTEENPAAITLKLSPEQHDEKMGELISILQERGVSDAIASAEATGSPHLIDDFHRVLVAYVREGWPSHSVPSKASSLGMAIGLSLLQVSLPPPAKKEGGGDRVKEIREFIGLMEQFYRGTLALGSDTFFALEIANAIGSRATVSYIAVPSSRVDAFEKQITALFPAAHIVPVPDDYNIFTEPSAVAAATARFAVEPIFALREEVAGDPMDSVLSALSKLDAITEGSALQVVIRPTDGGISSRFRNALQKIKSGTSISEATKDRGPALEMLFDFFRTVTAKQKTYEQKQAEANTKSSIQDDPRVKAIERKIANPILQVSIRVVASAATSERAQAIIYGIESAFEQLSDTAGGNHIIFEPVSPRDLKSFAHAFSYRMFDASSSLPLTSLELALMAHLPRPESIEAAPELSQEKNASAPAPVDMPTEGTLIGVNHFRGVESKAFMLPEDRLRHLYLVGQTGTGKSALLKNIVIQDIKNGNGVCFIDPHGTDVLDILSAIPPERAKDVIYFDPGDTTRPMGLNMLEYDVAHPEQKTLIVDELLGIFNKLFDMKVAGGPAFEQYFRNAALLVMDNPESGNTLLDIARIFSDESFREKKPSLCKNTQVVEFWRGMAEKATGDQGLQNFGPYITNKFDVFTTNEIMRPIISQQKSSFNIRQVMDEKKILLVNLAKGRIGDINANLLGLVIVGKFLLAALSRADSFGKELPPFYLTIDEFQNFTTPSISTILSEARKYKLSLTIAHQFIAQISEDIRGAVFGNVGSTIAFRVGVEDTEVLEKQFAPVFSGADLMRMDNYRAFVRLLLHGQPSKPFDIETLPFQSGTKENMEAIKDLSSHTYGRPREEVEAEIAQVATK